jgi:DNA-binding transcriptional regulator YdaS (Cro superfamily)
MDLKTYISKGQRGTGTKLAEALGVSPSYLSQLAHPTANVSPERCVEIEKATGGAVTRRDLRPSDWQRIWPELERRHKQRKRS